MEAGKDITQEQSVCAGLASVESIMSQKVRKKKGRKEGRKKERKGKKI